MRQSAIYKRLVDSKCGGWKLHGDVVTEINIRQCYAKFSSCDRNLTPIALSLDLTEVRKELFIGDLVAIAQFTLSTAELTGRR